MFSAHAAQTRIRPNFIRAPAGAPSHNHTGAGKKQPGESSSASRLAAKNWDLCKKKMWIWARRARNYIPGGSSFVGMESLDDGSLKDGSAMLDSAKLIWP